LAEVRRFQSSGSAILSEYWTICPNIRQFRH